MRVGFLVALLGALAIAAIGMMGSSEPDPSQVVASVPRARPAGAPQAAAAPRHAEPRPLEVVPGGALETQRMLRARDFAGLARRVEDAQARATTDARRESDLMHVLSAFDSADPTLTPLLDTWVASSDAWTAHLARATYFVAVAWQRRGAKWASETSDDQRAQMRDFLQKAVDDARIALERNPKAWPAYRPLIAAAMGVSDNRACIRLADQALAIMPASLRIRTKLAGCLLPRWGGSYDALTALAHEAAGHVKENPALASLAGWVDWDRGRIAASDKRYEDAVGLYTRALDAGEYWEFYEWRARAHYHQKHYTDALADIARALALEPDDRDLLVLRAKTFQALARPEDAVADVRLAAELDPTNDDLVSFCNHENEAAAFEGFQALEVRKDPQGAIRRLNLAIDMTCGSGDVFYRRGRAYLALSDLPTALADFEHAIALDPRHFEAYRNVDWILARQGDWDGIIQRWTRYIELEPMSGPAYLERGGARHHKGDEQNARADLRKACGLGTTEACELEKRLGG